MRAWHSFPLKPNNRRRNVLGLWYTALDKLESGADIDSESGLAKLHDP
jgi:hypothetical protein